jgi:ABC-type polysaccharide/polyol phosphate export permease
VQLPDVQPEAPASSNGKSRRARPLPSGWVHRTPRKVWHEGAREGAPSWLFALSVLTRHEFRARYRAQALGVVWSLLNPIVMMGILSLIFTRVFRSATPNFPIFMLIGLIVWQFVASAATAATGTFVSHAEIIKRTIFPRQLLPTAVMMSWAMNFGVESLVLFFFIPIFPEAFRLTPALLLIPVILAFLIILLAGVSLMVSVLNVIYRDVAYLVNTALLILYWLTPVIYPVEIIPEPYQMMLKCNPLTGILNGLRGCIMTGTAPTLLMWASIVLPSLLVFGIGWLVFKHYEKMVLDYV